MPAVVKNWLDHKIEMKKWIDENSFETLLMRWRHSSSEDEMFADDDMYNYYEEVINFKALELTEEEYKQAYRNTNLPAESDYVLWDNNQ